MAEHYRETTTDGDLYDPPEPGCFIVDCACGETYLVTKPREFGDELDALELAAAKHRRRNGRYGRLLGRIRDRLDTAQPIGEGLIAG
jgi:hypothetical protein